MSKSFDDTFLNNSTTTFAENSVNGGMDNIPPYSTNINSDVIKNSQLNTDEFDSLINIDDLLTNICIDWFNFRFNTDNQEDLKDVFEALKVDMYKHDNSGSRNYKFRYTYDENLHVSYHGDPTAEGYDTSLLEMSGKACRNFEKRGGNWYELIYACLSVGGRCTRLDIALDDFKGVLKLKEIDDLLTLGYYSSKLRSTSIKRIIKGDNGVNGYTINLGTGETRICIYDKVAERQFAGVDTFLKNWIRYEFRFYGERSNLLVKELLSCFSVKDENKEIDDLHDDNGELITKCYSLNQYVPRLINSIIEFKEYVRDSRVKGRDPINKKWQELLGTAEKSPLRNQADVEKTLAKKIMWLDRSCFKSIAQVYLMFRRINYGDDTDFFNYIIAGLKDIINDFTIEDIAVVNNYLRSIDESLVIFNFNHIKESIINQYDDIESPITRGKPKSKSLEAMRIEIENRNKLKLKFNKLLPF